ncbi:energy transducer TonB, partial [Pseudoxanthomonas kalamensis DSM 18571]
MSPAKPSESDDAFVLRLPRHSLQIVAAAFVIGLLLFLLVWWKAHDEQFYTVEPVAAPEAALPEALPEPLSGGMSTSRMQVPETASDGEHPQLVETTPVSYKHL